MNLADNLKKIRKDNNLSQEQLAEKLNVSRQSVSKWESGQSYPEMDKVIQICSLFNLNINELINENISEVNEVKESQNRTNKYISSFFDYITKVVDMFTSMKFGQILKCLFEQAFIILILFIVGLIISNVASSLFSSVFNFLPEGIFWRLYNVVESIFIVILMIIGTVILLHIFKIRYLDYYEIVKEDKKEPVEEFVTEVEAVEVKDEKKPKIILEKKKEKVVIRDPKHADYRFFTGLGKFILLCIKFFVALILGGFALSLIGFVICVPLTFLVIKNIVLFGGLLLSVIGCIGINLVVIELLYNFIFNRKFNKLRAFIVSVISLIVVGLGIGLCTIAFVNIEVVDEYYKNTKTEFELKMEDNIRIESWYPFVNEEEISYVEQDIDSIKIVVEHPVIYSVEVHNEDDAYIIDFDEEFGEFMSNVRTSIKYLNHGKVVDYKSSSKMVIYGSADTIAKLKGNYEEHYNNINQLNDAIEDLNKRVQKVSEEKSNLIIENERLKKNNYALVQELNDLGYKVHYDENNNYSYIEDLNE